MSLFDRKMPIVLPLTSLTGLVKGSWTGVLAGALTSEGVSGGIRPLIREL